MRPYPRNSPQAAARILSLAALADGSLSPIELATLEQIDAYGQLGLHPLQMQEVMRGLCADLLGQARLMQSSVCSIDPDTLNEVLAEIDDVQLRLTLLQLCVAVIEADACIEAGESLVLLAALEQWNLHWALSDAAGRPSYDVRNISAMSH